MNKLAYYSGYMEKTAKPDLKEALRLILSQYKPPFKPIQKVTNLLSKGVKKVKV